MVSPPITGSLYRSSPPTSFVIVAQPGAIKRAAGALLPAPCCHPGARREWRCVCSGRKNEEAARRWEGAFCILGATGPSSSSRFGWVPSADSSDRAQRDHSDRRSACLGQDDGLPSPRPPLGLSLLGYKDPVPRPDLVPPPDRDRT